MYGRQQSVNSYLRGLALAVTALAAGFALGQKPGELVIAPTRVVLEGKSRAAELVLANRGASTVTYRISIVEMRMGPDGKLERIPATEKCAQSARSMIRFAPRQVTLGPGESQRVRIGLVKPADLAVGEYRSHLLFEALPSPNQPQGLDGSNTLSLRFNVVGAVTLPVIVRNGQLTATAALDKPEVHSGDLTVHLRRSGERSVRGDVNVYLQTEGAKKRLPVGLLKDVAVYSPNEDRLVRIRLTTGAGLNYSGAKLIVTFQEPAMVGGGRAQTQVEVILPR